MLRRRITFILLVVATFFIPALFARETKQLTPEEIENYTNQCKEMINYLEGTFNFLGDSTQVPAEKEIIINNSYLKVFQSDETQIEDDLDPNREVPVMKDVQAYMKDIVFFFKNVTFTFQVNDVTPLVGENGEIVFKVTMNRNLKGITINNDTVDNNLTRYVEINLDPVQNDLKIASIYTTKPSRRQELKYWWEHLAESWKGFFADSTVKVLDTLPFAKITSFTDSALIIDQWQPDLRIDTMLVYEGDTLYPDDVSDSIAALSHTLVDSAIHYLLVPDTIPVNVDTLYQILGRFKAMKKINISGNSSFSNLDPLSELTDLVEVDLANTLIDDLTPLRNLNKVEVINCSSSKVATLEPLRYASNLTEINCANTAISDVGMLENLKKLNILDLSHTPVSDIEPLSGLSQLSRLDLSYTQVTDLSPIAGLSALTDLNIAGTNISDLTPVGKVSTLHNLNIDNTILTDLSPLDSLENLHILQANNSKINDITPLSGLTSLKFIYCDNSGIDEQKANRFMEKNPQTLVVYNTRKLEQWWEALPFVYKNLIKERLKTGDTITTEELHRIINITEVNLSYEKDIDDVSPLSMLHRLEKVNLKGTNVSDLSPLAELNNLQELDISKTPVQTLEPLHKLSNLKLVNCKETQVSDLLPLVNNPGLQTIYCDRAKVEQENVLQFRKALPACLVVWQSDFLKQWWNGLDTDWQDELSKQMKFEGDYNPENLQKLVNLHKITIMDNHAIRELVPLKIFMELKTLTVSNTGINHVGPVTGLPDLVELNVPNNPIVELPEIVKMKNLKKLNIENTPVEDLENISQLTQLQALNIAGTKIRKLKGIGKLVNLEMLVINNTQVKSLKGVENLFNLKDLKCYRTGIKSSKIEEFKQQHPGITVEYY